MKKDEYANDFYANTLRALLKNSNDMIFVKNDKLEYIDSSLPFANLVGYNHPRLLEGKTDYDIFPKALADKYTKDDKTVMNTAKSIIEMIEELPDDDGGKRYAATSKYPITDESGRVTGIYGIGRDITVNILLEEEIERREQYSMVFDYVVEADLTENVILRTEGGTLSEKLSVAKTARKIPHMAFDMAIESFAGKFIHENYSEEFAAHYNINKIKKAYNNGIRELSIISYVDSDQNGIYKWIEFIDRIYFSRISDTLRMVTYVKDMNDDIKNRESLRRIATTDALTGLMNRKALIENINGCLDGVEKGRKHALLFIDLDCFKQVNDTMGHPYGDKVLTDTAGRLKKIFGEKEIVGRFGGDEFLVLLRDIKNAAEVEQKAREVLKELPCEVTHGGASIYITCSIGISLCDKCDKKFDEMYEEADKAMYAAKKSGKNRLCFYD